jgi:hypothetical protein
MGNHYFACGGPSHTRLRHGRASFNALHDDTAFLRFTLIGQFHYAAVLISLYGLC